MSWDPQRYLDYAAERARPFADLVARIDVPGPSFVVDLGCGPGNATATLTDRWPGARVLGVDSSPEMVRRASELAGDRLSFVPGDIATWRPTEPVDVIVSNAALQWVPGHVALLPDLVAALRPGGALAFQVPAMSGSPAGRVFGEVAARPAWRDRLDGVAGPTVGAGDEGTVQPTIEYLRSLAELGCRVDAWDTTYYHVLAGADPVLDWFRSTGLRPYLLRLDGSAAADFLAEVGTALREVYPRHPYGTVLPFHRRFVVAYRRTAQRPVSTVDTGR